MILYSVLILFSGLAIGQQPAFYAEVNKNRVSVSDYVQLSFIIENGKGKNFKRPSLSDFDILNTQNYSSSSSANGRVTKKLSIIYLIKPRGAGKKTIGSAKVSINGKTYSTKPITIEAIAGKVQERHADKNHQNLPKKDVFVRAYLNKPTVYQGEQVLLTYKIFTRQGISNYSQPVSKFTGFWKEDIKTENPKVKRETINGLAYRTAIIKKVVLFPQKSGELKIPEAEMFVDLDVGFFNSKRVDLKSNPVKINVRSLPGIEIPEDYSGAVGQFELSSHINTTETKVDEAITLLVKIKGAGNLSLVDIPIVELPNDFEVYDPKVNESKSTRNNILSGTKSYEYLIIPRQEGVYKMKPVRFSYFDPKTKIYKTVSTQSYTLEIEGGGSSSKGSVSGISKDEVELLGKDILFIKTGDPALQLVNYTFFNSIPFFLLAGAPFLLFFGMFGLRYYQSNKKTDPDLARKRNALPMARKQLKQAKKLMAQPEDKPFYEAISMALWGYFSDRFGLQTHELSREFLEAKLVEQGINEGLSGRIMGLLDKCEMALYAPDIVSETRNSVYESSIKLIMEVENTKTG